MTTDAPSMGEALLGQTLNGKYAIEALIGEGSMGWVYRARQEPLKRLVAVKVMRSAPGDKLLFHRFTREAQVIAQLEHPNTVTLYDFGSTSDGRLYFAMEYVRGRTLRSVLDTEGALPAQRSLRIVEQVCGSLGESHDAGITHRDIKPANIMLSDRFGLHDVVTVVDFGVAKDSDGMNITGGGQIVGTPAYMAPELAGGGLASSASDIYSLGCMLYEMLTGAPPFGRLSAFTLVYKHVNQRPPPLPQRVVDQGGPRLIKLVDRMLHKRPEARPGAADVALAAKEVPLAFAVPPRPQRRERLRTMERMQAINRRRRARESTDEWNRYLLEVPEGSGRSAAEMVDDVLSTSVLRPEVVTEDSPAVRSPTAQATASVRTGAQATEGVGSTGPLQRPSRTTARSALPVFDRPQAEGRIEYDEHRGTMRIKAVGMGRLRMRFPAGSRAPKQGTLCQVYLPGEPVCAHEVPVEVVTTSYEPRADGVHVEAEVSPPFSGDFRAMVQYWSLKSRQTS